MVKTELATEYSLKREEMHFRLGWIAVLFLCSAVAHGGKVLVFPVDGSHWVNMKVIVEELHARGHQVYVIRAKHSWYIKETSPFYTAISIEAPTGLDEEFAENFVSNMLETQRQGLSIMDRFNLGVQIISEIQQTSSKVVEYIFENKDLMQSLRDAKYDLILTDPFDPTGSIISHYLSLPLVYNVRWTPGREGHSQIAPSPLSYVPLSGVLMLSDKMTFLERIINLIFFAFSEFCVEKYITSHYAGLIEKYLGSDVDSVSLFQAADLWLMRVDFVFEFPRPTMPNVIYMGGFQCKPSKPLPQHLEDFVQSSGEHGVIIMSLGSMVPELPHDLAEAIAAAFAQLPQKVIWRHKGRPATLGNNTLLVDWMPQNDLLGHAKTKAFVAHGGTNGVQEALYHGVPIVGLPLMFDQHDNLFKMEIRGAAKVIDLCTLNKDIFLQGIKEVLHEPSYRENMQRLSRLHRDTPMKPLDTAMFWIEFVMRHKGAAHLRTDSYKMPWYSYHSLDVMLFLIVLFLAILLSFAGFIKCLCSKVCSRRKTKSA